MNLFKKFLSRYVSTQNMSSFFHPTGEDKLIELLNEIPSETSLNERLMLYWLALTYGERGHIVELGPFLGGTTRALALGLQHNVIAKGRKVITIDRFDDYYKGEVFKKMNVLGSEKFSSDEMISFHSIFQSYHKSHNYFKNVETLIETVPDRPINNWSLDLGIGDNSVGILFVDGCKSWFSTKVFMKHLIQKIQKGSFVVFQDYGRFTCFWIPAFCAFFSDSFKLVGNVDSTFVFRYVGGLNKSIIENQFPAEPSETNSKKVRAHFRDYIAGSESELQKVNYSIQLYAYEAYLGNLSEAKKGLLELKSQTKKKSRSFRLINQALVSPTYTPEGPILLD